MDSSSSSSLDAAVVLNRAIFDLGIRDLLSLLAGGGGLFYNSWALFAAAVATGLSLWRIRNYYYYYSGSIISENHYYTQCNVDQLPSVNDFNSSTTPAAGENKATVLINTPETTHLKLRETKPPAAAILNPGEKMEEVLMMDGTKKEKFAAYFSGEEKERSVVDEDEDEEENGKWELGDVCKMSDIEVIRKPYPLSPVPHQHVGSVDIRTEMMKWFYEYQDMGVLDGRVVRLWDGCGGMRRKRQTGASSIGGTGLVC